MIIKEVLEDLILKGYTRKQVSIHLNVGYSTVYKYMSKYGLAFINREAGVNDFSCPCGESDSGNFYGGRKTLCKSCCNKNTVDKIKTNKEDAVKYKGGKCSYCGYNKCISALEFHHVDPKEKDPTWRMGWSFDRIKIEIDKCVLLCANCHREEHERISARGTIG